MFAELNDTALYGSQRQVLKFAVKYFQDNFYDHFMFVVKRKSLTSKILRQTLTNSQTFRIKDSFGFIGKDK
ncbi:hypothetical protein M5D10_16620 [Leptospira santarosai]|uniref:hypothetical protein n=1 Tax=Leptospira santarosai TaxID=28183 RepID=UPI000966FB82|nr:hypothetical protein [Leptospira santarosai]OLY62635.1 hypothetical protein BWD11_18845 [Leptospira santarosai serovar Grippotyphosa]ONF78963.1 hypothetical protein BWD12_09510 [Leptospira santarosai serovar Bananal]ASV12857.1 hypothetical protein B2G51_15870 [Leptospira santarosai]ONF89029.1 hypothetical protein BWD13_01075 [Leptospira santarosai serovar Grippotyphosa]UZN07369.1 hypothetical protein M5D10_16620 [Leptospira santarosai]